jgi:hypothetical protein
MSHLFNDELKTCLIVTATENGFNNIPYGTRFIGAGVVDVSPKLIWILAETFANSGVELDNVADEQEVANMTPISSWNECCVAKSAANCIGNECTEVQLTGTKDIAESSNNDG